MSDVQAARTIVRASYSECKECHEKPQREMDLCQKHQELWKAACLIDGDTAERTDKLHHAPMCPANHYHGQRAPTGRCTCGADEIERTKDNGAGI